ncbi:MAG: ABC-F family ATP-binding cassette domain-containing protein [Candidatus Margulisiibacteriota bacterium]|jgi:ATP-binding cassette subfamily F protein uup
MNLVSVQNLSCSQGAKTLFTDISFGINAGEKIALIGVNGCGKTTLLSMIANIANQPHSAIATKRGLRISYLAQVPSFNSEDTIMTHLFAIDTPIAKVIKAYEQCLEQLENDKSMQLQKQLSEITSKMDLLNAWEYEIRVRSILNELDIHHLDQQMKNLSGGMIKKIALAQIFLQDIDLLILDEPTNHLDIKTIEWLENMLKRFNTALLMVTHDRYFLDKICTRILEIDQQKLFIYEGNYEKFLEQKEFRYQNQQKEESNLQAILRVELAWLKRGPKARSTKQKARKQRIGNMLDSQNLAKEQVLELNVSGRRLGKKILELDKISKSFNDLNVIKDFSYIFNQSEKIGIIGPNGCGKTTLLNIIAQRIMPNSGEVDIGVNTVFGYFDQHSMKFDLNKAIYEHIKDYGEYIQMPDGSKITAAKLLERFLFDSSTLKTPIGKLSGGERRRLHLVCMLLENPNFLLFDEPTNDLDIKTLSILEDFLINFKGCLIIISHDRYFLDRVVDNLLVFEGTGKITKFTGSFTEYNQEAAIALRKSRGSEPARVGISRGTASQNYEAATLEEKAEEQIAAMALPKKKLTNKEQQELKALEVKIEKLETEKKQLETIFTHGQGNPEEYLTTGKRLKEITPILEQMLSRWEYLAEMV